MSRSGLLILIASLSFGQFIDGAAEASTANPEIPIGEAVLGSAPWALTGTLVATDGTEFFAAWIDNRASGARPEIYGTRISASGEVLDLYGLRLFSPRFPAPGPGGLLSLHSVGTHYVLFWNSGQAGFTYMTRFSPDGNVLDQQPRIINLQISGAAWNGSHFFVVYTQDGLLYAALLAADGTVNKRGIPFPRDRDTSQYVKEIIPAGSQFIVVWTGWFPVNLYSSQVTFYFSSVEVSADRLEITATSVIANPGGLMAAASSGSEILMIWKKGDLFYKSQFSMDGRPAQNASVLAVEKNHVYGSRLLWTGSHYLFVWQWESTVTGEAYRPPTVSASLLARDGSVISGPVLLLAPGSALPAVAVNSTGDTAMTWGTRDLPAIFTTFLRSSTLPPEGPPALLSQKAIVQTESEIATDGRDLMVVWTEFNATQGFEVRAARISRSGASVGQSVRITVTDFEPAPSIGFDGQNYIVAWREAGVIRYRRISPAGVFLDNLPFALKACGKPTLSAGASPSLLVWDECAPQGGRDLLAFRMGGDGSPLDPVPITLARSKDPNHANLEPAIAWNGSVYLVVWTEAMTRWLTWQISVTTRNVLAVRLSPSGQLLDPDPIQIAVSDDDQGSPTVAWNGNHFLILWAHTRHERYPPLGEIRGRRVSTEGVILDGSRLDEGLEIVAESARSWQPRVVSVGGQFFAAWVERKGDGDTDIWGALISGNAFGPLKVRRFPVSTTADEEQRPRVATTADGKLPVTYLRVAPGPPFGGVHRAFLRFAAVPSRSRPIPR